MNKEATLPMQTTNATEGHENQGLIGPYTEPGQCKGWAG